MSIGILMLVFFTLLFLGMPIGFVMAVSSFLYFAFSGNPRLFTMMPERIFRGMNMFVLISLPFFMMAGELMNKSGVSDRLITFSNLVIGRVRGGLAQVNVLASIIFAGITGVALGDVAALGTVFLPAMEKQGYDKKFTAAVTAASSILGPIIPPSLIIVLYAAVMQESVGAMFVAAIIPGLLIGVSDIVIVHYFATKRHYPKQTVKVTPREFLFSFKDAVLAIIMPVIIIGGIVGGLFTPTEAAVVSVAYALLLGFVVYRSLTLKDLLDSLRATVINASKLFFMLAGVNIIAWIFSFERLPEFVERMFTATTDNPYILLLLINLFFIFMGTWMDVGASILLFAPVVAPLAIKLGVNPVQFGIMIVINSCIGLCTPPVGVVLFAISDMAKEDLLKISKDLAPFLLINFIIILMVAYIPWLTLYLPRLLGFIQ